MNDLLLLFLAFASGCSVGFIAATLTAAGRKADTSAEFDGGYSASNEPPVRTLIWGGRVEDNRE